MLRHSFRGAGAGPRRGSCLHSSGAGGKKMAANTWRDGLVGRWLDSMNK